MSNQEFCWMDDPSKVNSFVKRFREDGFVRISKFLSLDEVGELNEHLDHILKGQYDRGSEPDKRPSEISLIHEDRRRQRKKRVLQVINAHKCDSAFRKLATNEELGRVVCKLCGWECLGGVRLAQDQIWAKPPGAPPLVFHRDSPYFMFTPDDVCTVWVALDDMDEELGPLEYVPGSHLWGKGRVGSSSAFFQAKGRDLLYSAAQHEGIDPAGLEIISMCGLAAGGISIHNGLTWHGSESNRSSVRPRRGVGIHYVPCNVKFTVDAVKSKLWSSYYNELNENMDMDSSLFPIVYHSTEAAQEKN